MCPACGGPVDVVKVGRPRRFCSSACSAEWHNENKRLQRELESVLAEAERLHRSARVGFAGPEWMRSNAEGLRLRALGLEDEAERLRELLAVRRAS